MGPGNPAAVTVHKNTRQYVCHYQEAHSLKYYAVKRGRQPGIYTTWQACKEQIDHYSGAVFKSFEDAAAAEEYLLQEAIEQPIDSSLPFAYIDGTYSKKNSCYGYGGFICNKGQYYIIQGTGNNPEFMQTRNVAGETIGALQVMFKAQRLQIAEINLYFDFSGIEFWANGTWKAVTPLARYYQQTADLMQSFVTVHFIKVKGHTGVKGNEIADYLAKEAAGAKLRKMDIEALAVFREKANQGQTE